jgi:hypothetical protein
MLWLAGHTRLKPGVNETNETVLLRPHEIGKPASVPKVPDASKDHRHFALVSRRDHFIVTD